MIVDVVQAFTTMLAVAEAALQMNVEIGTEAAQFPEKEHVNGIFLAVCGGSCSGSCCRGRGGDCGGSCCGDCGGVAEAAADAMKTVPMEAIAEAVDEVATVLEDTRRGLNLKPC